MSFIGNHTIFSTTVATVPVHIWREALSSVFMVRLGARESRPPSRTCEHAARAPRRAYSLECEQLLVQAGLHPSLGVGHPARRRSERAWIRSAGKMLRGTPHDHPRRKMLRYAQQDTTLERFPPAWTSNRRFDKLLIITYTQKTSIHVISKPLQSGYLCTVAAVQR